MAWCGTGRPEMPPLIERALRRDRWIVAAGLTALALLSWAYVIGGAGTGMSVWSTTFVALFPHRAAEMAMAGMSMPPTAWTLHYWIIMLLMWWVMMIAMMTPSAAPMILLYAAATRHAQAHGRLQKGAVPTAAFAGGYLLAWLGFSVGATIVAWVLVRTGILSDMSMVSTSVVASAAILMLAGVYQLSSWKRICLRHCRAPAEFLSRHWRPGASGALRMGLRHGAFCVGCCWMLMVLLFVGGIMNVLWIAVLAIFVLLEKITPWGPAFAKTAGMVLLAWGAATLAV